ncbi:MAG: hypothetical protein ACOCVX_03605 [Bacteroidales bacterium]
MHLIRLNTPACRLSAEDEGSVWMKCRIVMNSEINCFESIFSIQVSEEIQDKIIVKQNVIDEQIDTILA